MVREDGRPGCLVDQPLNRTRVAAVSPVVWVPSLYLAMGISYNVINGTASTMFKAFGVSDTQNTVAMGSLIVVWSMKPLWAAFLDMYRTKKSFVLAMELLLAVLFVGVAMALPLPLSSFFKICIALLWVAAFASATQDICGDGLYLTSLDRTWQARLAGVQGMFWNLGRILATGLLISGLEKVAGTWAWSSQKMWMAVWLVAGGAMAILAAYHAFVLPAGRVVERPANAKQVWTGFLNSATLVFHKRSFWGMIAFLFFYRLGEGLLMVEGKLFLQSPVASGGLGLTAGQVASIDAVWGTIASIAGGILGGMFLGKIGLKRALPLLALCLNVPHLTFVYLSHQGAAGHGLDYTTIAALVSIEKFGYGFGFIGNMVYMMQQFAVGRGAMTRYAFATGLMNLMLVPTTMISGPLAEWLGFSTFFLGVMLASIPSLWVAWRAPFPIAPDDGRATAGPLSTEQEPTTPDDPERLTGAQRRIQLIAGRASICAMLNILALLLIDAKALGSLLAAKAEAIWLPLGFLTASVGVKAALSWRAWRYAREAELEAAMAQETIYVRNARGARVVTALCGAASLVVLAVAVKLIGR